MKMESRFFLNKKIYIVKHFIIIMKRGALALAIFFLLIIAIGLVSAGYACDDDSTLEKKSKNIGENDLKLVNGVGIVVRQVDEAGAIGRLYAELVIDADKKKIENDTSSAQISLLSGNYTAKFFNAEGNYASLVIDSTTKRIQTDEWENIGNFQVLLLKLEFSGGVASAEIIAGKEELSLSNENTDKIVEINSAKYLIELISGSDDDATVSVGKCESGNLIEIAENVPGEPENETESELENNETGVTEQTIIESEPAPNNETAEKKQIGEACDKGESCKSGKCMDGICSKKGFFEKIIEWFSNLFKN